MKEKNLLKSYPKPRDKRLVSESLRTIEHRIRASERGEDFLIMMVDGSQ